MSQNRPDLPIQGGPTFILSTDLTVGYANTAVSVLENEGVAQLTVAISMPPRTVPIETSFSLLINTVNGAATGLSEDIDWSSI